MTLDAAATWAHAQRLREDGRVEAAMDLVAGGWEHAGGDVPQLLATLRFLLECGGHARAWPLARDGLQHWPRDARVAALAGEIALALGHFDDAASALRTALDLDPRQGVWLRLAHCRKFTERDADVRRFELAWANADLDMSARLAAGFALGKALDDLDEYARATVVLRDANAQAARVYPWNRSQWRGLVDAQLAAPPLPRLPAETGFTPVFVVGLPRTGTTLIACALARHADVRDRGELDFVSAFHALLREQAHLHNPQSLAAVTGMIAAQLRRDDAPARFYIDKNPLNFRYLDFIAACFPQAKIVHCRRAAPAAALSLWMQHFAHVDLGFAYDFADIASVQRDCDTLMSHWRERLPLPVHVVDYERFVADPEDAHAQLARFLGLDPTSPPASGTGAVTTASVWQVRQPVYRHAVERWRHYAPFLPELARFADNSPA
jgi:tetratricopeptide (TPR) repeat protein